ncbi:MAG: tetratricopeptide repeat protein [bacterium]
MQSRFLISLLLVAATLAVFAPVCRYDFIQYDDSINVCDNPYVSHPSLRSIIRFWVRPYANMYIPVTYSVWWFGANLSRGFTARLDPSVFHVMNLVVHSLAVLVVFKILLRLVRRTNGGRNGAREETAAAFGALLFAVHPLQVQAVAWITGMKAVLSGFLSLLALNWYIAFATVRGGDGGVRCGGDIGVETGRNYFLATIAFLLAMLSKPSAVALVPAAWIVDCGVLKRSIRKSIGALAPWAALAAPVILLTKSAQPDRCLAFIPSPWERLVVAGDAIAVYIYKLIVPLRLGLDYGRSPAYIADQGWRYLTCLVPCALAVLLSIPKGGRRWLVPFGLLIAGVLPVLGVVPAYFQNLSTVQDHFLYFSMVGPALAFAYLLTVGSGRAAAIVCAIVLIMLAACSIIQCNIWRSDFTVAGGALEINPQSVVARLMLGNACAVRGGTERAILYYSEAVRLDPDSTLAHYNLGVLLAGQGKTGDAMSHYGEAVRIDPEYAEAYCAMGNLLADAGETDNSLAAYAKALGSAPDLTPAHKGMGLVLAKMGKTDEALHHFVEAFRLEPGDAETRVRLGDMLFAKGRFDEAIAHYSDSLRFNPHDVHILNNLGNALLHQDRIDEAIVYFSEALRIDAGLAETHSNLAFALTERGKIDEAIFHYNKALSIRPDFENARRGLQRVLEQRGRP